jgi:uncharacterized protein
MRSWVYGASYGAASSAIVLVAASLLLPHGDVISDEPPAAQVNSDDLMATVSAESKSVTISTADPATPGQSVAAKPEEPVGDATFAGLEVDIPAPVVDALDLSLKAAPASEGPPEPPTPGDAVSPRVDLVLLASPAAEAQPVADSAKPPYYGANVIQPNSTLVDAKVETQPATTPADEAAAGDAMVVAEATTSETALPRTESRLPQIGGEPIAVVEPEAAPDAAGDTLQPDAMVTNTAAWADPGLPKIAVILTGAGAEFAVPALEEVPVSVVVNALNDSADSMIGAVRASGQEVVLATPLPAGATATDVQVAFEAYQARVGQGVAVIEPEDGSFRSRDVAQAMVDLAVRQGFGLVSVSQGLNPVRQLAGPAGAHAGLVEEDLAAVVGDMGAFARALDKAAFKAGQDGSVILLAPATPEVIAALKDWAQSARGKTVALAPVSAVLAGL